MRLCRGTYTTRWPEGLRLESCITMVRLISHHKIGRNLLSCLPGRRTSSNMSSLLLLENRRRRLRFSACTGILNPNPEGRGGRARQILSRSYDTAPSSTSLFSHIACSHQSTPNILHTRSTLGDRNQVGESPLVPQVVGLNFHLVYVSDLISREVIGDCLLSSTFDELSLHVPRWNSILFLGKELLEETKKAHREMIRHETNPLVLPGPFQPSSLRQSRNVSYQSTATAATETTMR